MSYLFEGNTIPANKYYGVGTPLNKGNRYAAFAIFDILFLQTGSTYGAYFRQFEMHPLVGTGRGLFSRVPAKTNKHKIIIISWSGCGLILQENLIPLHKPHNA